MLLEQLKELSEYGMVTKLSAEGYPLQVTYFLTPRGQKFLEALTIMQRIGMDLMRESDHSQ